MTRFALLAVLALGPVLVLGGCAGGDRAPAPPGPELLAVSGALTMRARIALPSDSVAVIVLRQDDSGRATVAEQRIALQGRQVPIPFRLVTDWPVPPEGGRYTLAGTVEIGGRAAWTTAPVPLVALGSPVEVGALDLAPVRVGARDSAAAAAQLAGGEWVVDAIDGRPARRRPRATIAFGPDGRVTGRAACNGYGGTYLAEGAALTLSRMRATLRACASAAMTEERRLLDALAGIDRFRIDGDGRLVLLEGERRRIEARRG